MELTKLLLLLLSTFGFAWFALPTLIKISTDGNFFDKPDHIRKVHVDAKPNIGGVAIFLSFLFGCILFLKATAIEYSNFLLGATMIIFSMGVRDDFLGLSAYKKMGLQILAAILVVVFAEVRISSFYGLFGIFELNYWVSVPFSIFVIIVVTNAFNLIDGIDGLAASIGIVITLTFGILFYDMEQLGWARIAVALCGALLGFIPFNFEPSKIFMGDTGAYIIGFIIAILSIEFIEFNKFNTITNVDPFIKSSPAVGIGFLFVPLFDTLRAFIIRISQGKSPLFADRQHLHHFLLDRGWSHSRIALFMAGMSLFFIVLCLLLQEIGSFYLITLLVGIGVAIHIFITVSKKKMENN
jgi:UDP-N-acetylmuramyl pentapeptide phosphotransferase/UDP-N-acetylglucosamine-1-phosphate transferase